jgi:hypothetical protein
VTAATRLTEELEQVTPWSQGHWYLSCSRASTLLLFLWIQICNI